MQNRLNYNPDVLSCLANLSNDEVFTPPDLANKILDLLPNDIWCNKEIKFLDPVSKSGVFLREITKRLMRGLEKEIPDKQKRVNHILKNQVYGIAITELTSLLSRRSLYCSKTANNKYSLCEDFDNEQGNILFNRIEHTWQNSRCKFCGASKENYDRDSDLETHAYQFIHTEKPEEVFNMKFDVIIGNPPYQLSDGGAQQSASPIYHHFIRNAKKLNPKYLIMIIPARWYNGGKGLDDFRNEMLTDGRIRELHDFPETTDCFPGLNIRGGVCYFLWDKDYHADCLVTTYKGDGIYGKPIKRPLLEKGLNVFIRYNESLSIFKKVQAKGEKSFREMVSAMKPFGLPTNFLNFKKTRNNKDYIELFRFGDKGYVNQSQLVDTNNVLQRWKVFVPKASPGDDSYPHLILSRPIVAKPNTCCTETYLVVGSFDTEKECKNVANYMKTFFCRFMILLAKSTQDVTRKVYSLVPIQDFTKSWTDEMLYKKYGLSEEEIAFIEGMIKPMELGSE